MTIYSGIALAALYVLAYICDLVFKIHTDKFYSPFHLMGGFLVFVFLNSFIQNKAVSLALVIVVGILWEIYEYILWKLFKGKPFKRPKKKDTTYDLIFDFIGGLTSLILTTLI